MLALFQNNVYADDSDYMEAIEAEQNVSLSKNLEYVEIVHAGGKKTASGEHPVTIYCDDTVYIYGIKGDNTEVELFMNVTPKKNDTPQTVRYYFTASDYSNYVAFKVHHIEGSNSVGQVDFEHYAASVKSKLVSVEAKNNQPSKFYPKGNKITWNTSSYAVCTAIGQTWDHAETGWINFDRIISVSSKYKLGNGSKGYIYLLEQNTNRKITIVEPHFTSQNNTTSFSYDGVTYTYMKQGDATGSLDTSVLKGLYKICYEGASYNNAGQSWFYPVEVSYAMNPIFNSNSTMVNSYRLSVSSFLCLFILILFSYSSLSSFCPFLFTS